MRVHHTFLSASWKTSLFGVLCIIRGVWLWHIQWVPHQKFWFNFNYATVMAQLFIAIGIALLLCRDHNVSSEDAGVKRKE